MSYLNKHVVLMFLASSFGMLLTISQRDLASLNSWHLWTVGLCSFSLPLLVLAAGVVLKSPNGSQELEDSKLAKFCGALGIAAGYAGTCSLVGSYNNSYISWPFACASLLGLLAILHYSRKAQNQRFRSCVKK